MQSQKNQANYMVRIDEPLSCEVVRWESDLNSDQIVQDVERRVLIEHSKIVPDLCQDSLQDYAARIKGVEDIFHVDINKAKDGVADVLVDRQIYSAKDMSQY
jgi:hypothetical protein